MAGMTERYWVSASERGNAVHEKTSEHITRGVVWVSDPTPNIPRETGVLCSTDFALAIHAMHKEDGVYVEHRSLGQFGALLEWVTLRDTGDKAFAAMMRESLPYKTSGDLLWAVRSVAPLLPQAAIDIQATKDDLEAIMTGVCKVEGFGSLSIRALQKALGGE